MILLDVNVVVYAYWEEAPEHAAYAGWLRQAIQSDEPCGISDAVLSGMGPDRDQLPHLPHGLPDGACASVCRGPARGSQRDRVEPGARHWPIFTRLCRDAGAKGDLIPDAWLAALAIESGSELITADRGFARFPALRWRHPVP